MAALRSTRPSVALTLRGVPTRTAVFLALAVLLALKSSSIALRQGSRPDPFRPTSTAEWWRYPIQDNAFARNEAFAGDLNAVYVRPGGQRVWAVGDGALLVHSDDDGLTWVQDSLDMSPDRTVTEPPRVAAESSAVASPPVDTVHGAATLKMSMLPISPLTRMGSEAVHGLMHAGTSPRQVQQSSPGLHALDAVAVLLAAAMQGAPISSGAQDSLLVLTATLRDVQFVNNEVGYAVGDNGVVLRTTDGGVHWHWTGNRLHEARLLRVLFDAPHPGYVRTDSAVYRTMDSGRNWTRIGSVAAGDPVAERLAQRTVLSHTDALFLDSAASQGDWFVSALLASEVAAGRPLLTVHDLHAQVEHNPVLSDERVGKRRISADRPLRATISGLTSAMFVDTLQGWAVSSDGRVYATSNSGASWNAQTAGGPALHDVHFADSQRGWAVGAEGTILSTDDGGRTWMVRAGRRDRIRGVAFADSVHGWAVGSGGVILATSDGGHHWAPQASPTDSALNAVSFATVKSGVAVGGYGIVLRTVDAGRRWTAVQVKNAPSMVRFQAVQMMSGGRGWIAGSQGAVFTTTDDGATWESRSVPAGPDFRAIAFRPNGTGWVAGSGRIYYTADDGHHWSAASTPLSEDITSLTLSPDQQKVWAAGAHGWILDADSTFVSTRAQMSTPLTAIRFTDAAHGWVAGWNGALFSTGDSGRTWKQDSTGTRADLLALAAPDGRHLLAAGEGRVFLSSDGSGRWQITALPGRWLPAPWYAVIWVVVIALVLLSVPQRPPPPSDPVEGILIPDRPLQPGDPDPFQLDEVALGISRFLRNERTEPPLTLAVTGPWGSGKSSLMNLIRADLQKRGFRTVAFNAWHHQTEDHLLAAFLETVRQQAVPPWWSIAGARFHARLLWIRTRRQLPLAVIASVLAAAYVAWLLADPARFGDVVRSLGELVPKSGDLAGKSLPDKITTMLTTLIPGPEQGTAVVGLLGALGVVGASLRGAKAFGVKPASLMASVTGAMRLRDLEAQTGFRHRFAAEFDEVTRALSPRDMVIFVDDLDRCRSAQVLQILEAINFLVTSGRCVVIMGMEPERVIRSVGREFGEEVEDTPDARVAAVQLLAMGTHGEPGGGAAEAADPAQALRRRRDAFARQYLEKLVNIEVPVPRGEEDQQRKLLEPTVLDERRRTVRERMVDGARVVRPALPVAATVALCAFILIYGHTFFRPRVASLPTIGFATSTQALAPAQFVRYGPPARARAVVSTPSATSAPPAEPARAGFRLTHTPRAPTRLPLYLGMALALAAWAFRFATRPDVVVHDSDEFRRALRAWSPYIVAARQPTPRTAKKFLNRVRYYAMRQSAHTPPDTVVDVLLRRLGFRPPRAPQRQRALSEELLVALAAVQECAPDRLMEAAFYSHFNKFLKEVEDVSKDAHERIGKIQYPAVIGEDQRKQFSRISAGIRMS